MSLFYRPDDEPRPSRREREDYLLRKLSRTTDWAFTPGEYEGEVQCPLDGTELDIHLHGGASCPQCGHEYEVGKGGIIIPTDLTIPEMANEWPDILPWGEAEQHYYRTAGPSVRNLLGPRRVAYPFLFEPNSKWLTWGQPFGQHDDIYESLAQQGSEYPRDYPIYHGRYFPGSLNPIKIYEPSYPLNRGGERMQNDFDTILRNAPETPQEPRSAPPEEDWTPSPSPNEMDDWNPFTG